MLDMILEPLKMVTSQQRISKKSSNYSGKSKELSTWPNLKISFILNKADREGVHRKNAKAHILTISTAQRIKDQDRR